MHNLYYKRDTICLTAALLLLLSAVLFKPVVYLPQKIRSYFLVIDISQSMNVEDKMLNGVPTSRLNYTRELLHELVSRMPCGTYVSIGLLAGTGVTALYNPLEVCAHFNVVHDTISHIDWKSAWSANSRIRESLSPLATVVRSFPEATQPVIFTDGEETPKLHAFNTKDLKNFQGGANWLFVGIGGRVGTPIPKYNENNQLIGYWSNESFAVQPGISQISEGNLGARDESVAMSTSDRYLSKLDEPYLKSLVEEIDAKYVKGDSIFDVVTAMQSEKPTRLTLAPFELNRVLAGLAGLLVICAYIPRNPIRHHKKVLKKNQSNEILPL